MTFLGAATLLIPILFGVTVVTTADVFKKKTLVLATGITAGFSFFMTSVLLLSIFLSLSKILIGTWLALMLAASGWLIKKYQVSAKFKQLTTDKAAVTVWVLCAILFAIIAPKLLLTENGVLRTGIVNAYGDIAWHTANITFLAENTALPPLNPIFAQERLTYPFLTNFGSSIFYEAGMSLPEAVNWIAWIMIPVILVLLYHFASFAQPNEKLKSGSGILAVILFLFGGATLGWLRFGPDYLESGKTLFEFLLKLPRRDYSGVGSDTDGFHFLNPVTSLLLPQRAFLFGMSMGATILLLLTAKRQKTKKQMILAGVLAGTLPLFHAHTVLVLAPVIALLFAFDLKQWKQWAWFLGTALTIGLPEVFYYLAGGVGNESFFRFDPGWLANGNVIIYWLKNTGLLIPVGILGLFLKTPRILKIFTIVGLAILLASNLFLFAPWAWDNYKLIVWWFILSLPMVAWIVMQLWQRQQAAGKFLIACVVGVHVLAGGLDAWKISLPTATNWVEWDQQQIDLAEKIKEVAGPEDVILSAPIHNNIPALTGRAIYLGYAAHIWSHGGDPWKREKAIKEFYEGRIQTLPDVQPDWVIVGPVEENKYDVAVQPSWRLVYQNDHHALYYNKK